jgi:hypothetical protein
MTHETKKALDLALEALEFFKGLALSMNEIERAEQAITAIKQARSAPVQEFGLTWERFNALEAEMATLQAEWQAALKEIEGLKAAAPVAVVSGYYGGQCVVTPTDPARVFNTGTAFYTTPPAAQPAVPLTEPELRAVLKKTNDMITNTMCGPFWPELEQACRAIEAAHGITAAPEKGN